MTVAVVIALMVVGLGLLAAELLVIPGFGLIGLLGIGTVVGAGVLAFTQLSSGWGAVALVSGLGAAGLMAWLLPRTKAGKAMVLAQALPKVAVGLADLVDQEGEAVTPLRPAGSARVGDRVVDVVAAEGAYIEAGARVRVVKVEGMRVVVEPART
jgi:membrane-bound serine protease (ClpP class)